MENMDPTVLKLMDKKFTMPFTPELEMLKLVSENIRNIHKVKTILLDKAIEKGASWKDIAPYDRVSAIQYCRDLIGCDLRTARATVQEYLNPDLKI
jgi:hypothetical protein